ncbi:MAG: hypothetical protein F4137_12585 [Acidobacteria bacterium]|nr:hypothetical protein [Acidobacteriota bacterium]
MDNEAARGSTAPTGIRTLIPVLALTLTLAPALPGLAQEPSLWLVLVRATHYVEQLHAQLSGVVMEERYEQRATQSGVFQRRGNDAVQRATLRSDYLLVQPEGARRHFGFRDVFEANGSRVRDRDDRLAGLFLDTGASLDDRVRGILAESARYNVGDVRRTTNTPTFALLFLRESYKRRFAFERVADRPPGLGVDLPESAGVWVVAYRETAPTTVVRGGDRENVPARGHFWIEAASGRVLASELALDGNDVESLVAVRYGMPPELEHPAPVEMRERYLNLESGSEVEGVATYSRFRRFRVVVDESEPFRN